MNRKILSLILIIFAFAAASAAAQDFYKSRSFPPGNLLSGIQEHSDSLVYISEQDWDVNAFVIGRNVSVLDAETFRSRYPQISFEEIEDFPAGYFWARLEQQDGSWTRLKNYLEANLTQIHVFKIGSVRRDIYVVGIHQGHIVGIRTFGVET